MDSKSHTVIWADTSSNDTYGAEFCCENTRRYSFQIIAHDSGLSVWRLYYHDHTKFNIIISVVSEIILY